MRLRAKVHMMQGSTVTKRMHFEIYYLFNSLSIWLKQLISQCLEAFLCWFVRLWLPHTFWYRPSLNRMKMQPTGTSSHFTALSAYSSASLIQYSTYSSESSYSYYSSFYIVAIKNNRNYLWICFKDHSFIAVLFFHIVRVWFLNFFGRKPSPPSTSWYINKAGFLFLDFLFLLFQKLLIVDIVTVIHLLADTISTPILSVTFYLLRLN